MVNGGWGRVSAGGQCPPYRLPRENSHWQSQWHTLGLRGNGGSAGWQGNNNERARNRAGRGRTLWLADGLLPG